MEALLVSTGVVALGEMGDKTQLLAIVLAARYKKPLLIILGIFLATIANHAIAAVIGQGVASLIGADLLKWILGISFIAMAIWIMIPDKIDDDIASKTSYGVLLTTIIAFFIAEIGDKTQIATVALAANYNSLIMVIVGTTVGMMLANIPAVYGGQAIANKIPMRLMHSIAAVIFVIVGITTLVI